MCGLNSYEFWNPFSVVCDALSIVSTTKGMMARRLMNLIASMKEVLVHDIESMCATRDKQEPKARETTHE